MINNDIEIRFGAPCISGTRISVSDVLGYIAGGDTYETLLENFPELTKEKIKSCILFAADSVNNNKLKISNFDYENIGR